MFSVPFHWLVCQAVGRNHDRSGGQYLKADMWSLGELLWAPIWILKHLRLRGKSEDHVVWTRLCPASRAISPGRVWTIFCPLPCFPHLTLVCETLLPWWPVFWLPGEPQCWPTACINLCSLYSIWGKYIFPPTHTPLFHLQWPGLATELGGEIWRAQVSLMV